MHHTIRKYRSALIMCSVLTLISSILCAQEITAKADESVQKREGSSKQRQEYGKMKFLVDVLNGLEKKFKVSFAYESEIIEPMKMDISGLDLSNKSLPENLKELPPTLVYHKVSNSVYAIYQKDNGNRKKRIGKRRDTRRISDVLQISDRFASLVSSHAQEVSVSGTVTSGEDGSALPGVNIIVKGLTIGTTTDADGKYTIRLRDGSNVLIFSFIGYESQEVEVGGRTVIDVVLMADVRSLEEVVVVGYGTVRKRDLTGSVSRIEAAEISKTPLPNVDQALQGQAAGVFVTSIDGSPGAQSTIRIRGGKSINAGNEPLFVIDGFISDRGIVSALNPEDIQSIDVLKDASAAAIYGARGSNGVILVTTKRGVAGETQVRISTSYGLQEIARKADVLNAQEYITFANQGETYLGNALAFTDEDRDRIGEGTDWINVLSRTAPMYKAQLSVSGGSEKTRFYLSGNYFNQKGILVGNDYRRGTMRLNLDHKFSNFFEIGTNFNLSGVRDNPASFSWDDVLQIQPTLPVRQPDGSYTLVQDLTFRDFQHPLARNEFIHNAIFQNQILSNTYLQFNFMKDLRLRSTFGINRRDGRAERYHSSQYPLNQINDIPGSGRVEMNTHTSLLTENTLTYDWNIRDKHQLTLLGGITLQREQSDANITSSSNTLTDLLSVYGLGLSSPEFTNVEVDYDAFSLISFIGRANYIFNDKYLLTLTARRDGSSKFGTNNRYAFFPAVAFGWRLSNEEFISNLNVFDFLKLRLSYGKSGNSNGISSFQRFQALETVFASLGRGVRDVGVINNTLANEDLRWETTSQYDAGIEAGFFEGRLNFEVDFFYSVTDDLLFTREIASQSGFINRLENIGSVENKGIDFSMDAAVVSGDNFTWNVGLNISTYKNKILDLGSGNRINTHTGGNLVLGPTGQLIEGHPLGIFTGFVTNGIYQNEEQVQEDNFTNGYVPGEFRFVDQNGDGTIDVDGDLVVIGDSNPDFFGGLQNTLKYRNFQLSAFFQFTYGNDIYNLPKTTMVRVQERNPYGVFRNSWSPENTNTDIPSSQAINAQSSNDFNVEDGSFLRLRTLELAYNLSGPNRSFPFKNARVYLSGTNIFQIISNEFSGDDPESNNFGTNDRLRGYYNFGYPYARILMAGLELTF